MLKIIEKRVAKQPFDMPLDQLHQFIDDLFDKLCKPQPGRDNNITRKAHAVRASV